MMDYRDLLNIPYKRDGRDSAGLDCWGLCIEVARRAGIALPDYPSPGNAEDVGMLMESAKAEYVRISDPEPFSLAAFASRGKYVDHIGIVMETGEHFMHCSPTRGRVTVERLNHPLWSKILAGFYRHKKR